jgi:glycosyltransferase involved in cell wall biosynthesis
MSVFLGHRSMKLTACLCVHDEERHLDACLQQLSFCDQIVVALDKCTDGSKAIALARGATIVEGAWSTWGERREASNAPATGEWCLEVDADERIPPELADEIRRTIETSEFDYHLVPVDNFVGERLVRYGWGAAWGKSAHVALYKRGHKHWGHNYSHPKVKMDGRKGPMLTGRIQHKVDDDISDMIRRLDRYTTELALDLRHSWAQGKPKDPMRRWVGRFFARFYKTYVLRKGYKEGGYGVLIALMAAIYPILSYLKATLEDGKK